MDLLGQAAHAKPARRGAAHASCPAAVGERRRQGEENGDGIGRRGALNAVDELASIRPLHTHPRLTMGPKRLVYVENGKIQEVQ